MSLQDRVLGGYERHAAELVARYDAVDSADLYEPVADLIPTAPCQVLDVGAGNGRDAEWLMGFGHRVTAVEPVAAFRRAIEVRCPGVALSDSALPALDGMVGPFQLITINGVWHHLTDAERELSIERLSTLVTPQGRMVLSLRVGPNPSDRPGAEVTPAREIARGLSVGLRLMRRAGRASHQAGNRAAGVTWTWLVFERMAAK